MNTRVGVADGSKAGAGRWIGDELNNRPERVGIPLAGVLRCLDDAATASEKPR